MTSLSKTHFQDVLSLDLAVLELDRGVTLLVQDSPDLVLNCSVLNCHKLPPSAAGRKALLPCNLFLRVRNVPQASNIIPQRNALVKGLCQELASFAKTTAKDNTKVFRMILCPKCAHTLEILVVDRTQPKVEEVKKKVIRRKK